MKPFLTFGIIALLFASNAYSQTAGSLDLSFDPGNGTNSVVESIAVQDDGKILIGGTFNSYNGTTTNGIARLLSDGTLDTTFIVGDGIQGIVQGQQYHVYDIAIQDDGKIIVVGAFHFYQGVSRNRIARLNSDGTLDSTFDPGNGPDGTVRTIDIQSDGKLVIGGSFTYYNNFPNDAPYIARINTDGTQDLTFDPGTGTNLSINSLSIQNDGKIMIGGDFTSYNGTSINRVARVNADGSLDNSFDPASGPEGTFPSVRSIKVQGDGKIVITGYFETYAGISRRMIVRTNADGTIDNSFNPGTGGDLNSIHKVAIQSNKIIIVGSFYNFDGTSRNSIARLNLDGSLDTAFDPGFGCNNTGEALALQSDGAILIGGNFTFYDGTARNHIARIHNDSTNGLSDLSESHSSMIFPNPSNGFYQVKQNTSGLQYEIRDANGRMVKPSSNDHEIDLTGFADGVYFLKWASGETTRLIKQ